jgi:hypothetical protein
MDPNPFFAYARARHAIHLRRTAGRPRSEWTSDPVLAAYRFCNIFRELDRTTIWFRDNVREGIRDRPEVLLATVLFRWFNRITTGEAIFRQAQMRLSPPGAEAETPWDSFLSYHWEPHEFTDNLRRAIVSYCGRGPYVTGSYIIKTPDGRDKLDGVLWCVEQFMRGDWREYALTPESKPETLEDYWTWLCGFPYLGPFMAYEIVTDLRHTMQLERAPDIMTWANPGPGARRGLNRLHGRRLEYPTPRSQLILEMQELLVLSQEALYWPQFECVRHDAVMGRFPPSMRPEANIDLLEESMWPAWEMREVEHTLCEWDKYERIRLGQGRPRQVFR